MWDLLEKLRAMPERDRRTAAAMISAGVTLLIVIPWFLVHRIVPEKEVKTGEVATQDLVKPFAAIKDDFSQGFGGIIDKWNALTSSAKAYGEIEKNRATSGTPELPETENITF